VRDLWSFRGNHLVSFTRSGLSIRSEAAYNSVLELAEACDVPARWFCRTGSATALVAGTVNYAPRKTVAETALSSD